MERTGVAFTNGLGGEQEVARRQGSTNLDHVYRYAGREEWRRTKKDGGMDGERMSFATSSPTFCASRVGQDYQIITPFRVVRLHF